jgi:hypothetical protein
MTLADRSWRRLGPALLLGALVAGCSGDAPPREETYVGPPRGPQREYGMDPAAGKLFGDDVSLNSVISGEAFRDEGRGDGLPVNKYLWQASLDTLEFLPLVSTDPFTGVIATDWAGTPEAPGERLKVTAYLTKPELEASSLRVAVYRQVSDGQGGWQPAPVSPETVLRLENAILARARQLRIADIESGAG